jgi:competence protein ComEC
LAQQLWSRHPPLSDRALWAGTAAFALGIAAFHQLPFLLPPWLLATPLILLLLMAYRWRGRVLPLAAAVAAGFAWQGVTAIDQRATPFPVGMQGETVQVEGWIAGPVADKPRRRRFRFRVERLRSPDGEWRAYEGGLRLSWYRPVEATPAYGQRWRLAVRVRRPRGFRNPGGFDYARYLRARGLAGTGYVRDDPAPVHLPGSAGSPVRRAVERLRRQVQTAVAAGAGEASPLVRALTVGKRDQLDPATWDMLQVTGTGHLVAISGLHVGWVTFLVFALARTGWARLPRAPLALPAPRFAAAVALLAAVSYAALSGLRLPAQRALIMVAVGLGAWLLGRPFRFGRALAVAALAVLVWAPDSLLAPGFWLSFTAVAGIGLLLHGPLARRGPVARTVVIQLAVVAMVSPWLAFWFGRISLIAPLANAVAVPLFSLLVVPLALLGSLAALLGLAGAAEWAFAGAGWLLEAALPVLEGLARLPAAAWPVLRPDLWQVGLLLGGLALLAGLGGRRRWFGLGPLVLAGMTMGPPAVPPGQANVWILDVGQGSSAVVETAEHVVVVDCGPRFSRAFNAGEALVAPFLQERGWARVDRLLISHGDGDHSGGCPGLRKRLPVGEVMGSPGAVAREGQEVYRGDGWAWDGVRFRLRYPEPGEGRRDNEASRVLEVVAEHGSVLLPGDVEAGGERRLLAQGEDLAADVVVAPHHGSTTSSSPAFVQATAPRWVVFSVGHDNRWGFPDPAVVARYGRVGARTVTTAGAGAVRIRLGPELTLGGYREQADGYWNAGAPPPPVGSLAALWRP